MNLVTLVRVNTPRALKDAISARMSEYFRRRVRYFAQHGPSNLNEALDPHYFIHIPKCAGNSVKKYIDDNGLPIFVLSHSVTHPTYKYPHEISRKHNPRAFCIIRDPFERLASAYFYLKKGGMDSLDAAMFEEHLSQYDDFQDFVINGLGSQDTRDEILQLEHFIPQTTFVVDGDGDLCVADNNIIRFENLNADFARYVRSRGGEPNELPWENRTRNGQNYRDLYRHEKGMVRNDMVGIVADVYRKDFERFGYTTSID